MAKEIKYDVNAREMLKAGADALAKGFYRSNLQLQDE